MCRCRSDRGVSDITQRHVASMNTRNLADERHHCDIACRSGERHRRDITAISASAACSSLADSYDLTPNRRRRVADTVTGGSLAYTAAKKQNRLSWCRAAFTRRQPCSPDHPQTACRPDHRTAHQKIRDPIINDCKGSRRAHLDWGNARETTGSRARRSVPLWCQSRRTPRDLK